MPLISVCICTFHRNELLDKLLHSLLHQQIMEGLSYEIIVVDNDKDGQAQKVVESILEKNKNRRIVYDIEPQQNIALARNRTLKYAQGDFIAFIDDDEYPSSRWLQNLYETRVATNADAVMGPVIPEYPEGTPQWIIMGKFFERPNPEDQAKIYYGRTSNALVLREWFDQLVFDARYGLTGGSDSDLFKRIIQNGGTIFWSRNAYVTERVDENRLNLTWLLARAFRGGVGAAEHKYSSKLKLTMLPHLIYRLGLVIIAIIGAMIAVPFGRHRSVWWLRKVASNMGQLSAILPYRYEEYRK